VRYDSIDGFRPMSAGLKAYTNLPLESVAGLKERERVLEASRFFRA
jgi:hypothetical protein